MRPAQDLRRWWVRGSRRWWRAFLLLLLPLFLTGCWDRIEIEDRAIIMGLGIDRGEEVRVTYQFPLVSKLRPDSHGDGPSFITKTCSGRTIGEAMERLQGQIQEAVFFGHIRTVVFSETAATRGVQQEIDFLRRDPMVRPQVYVIVTPQTAQEFLDAPVKTEQIPSLGLVKMITHDARLGRLPKLHLGEFLVRLDSPAIDPVAPIFHQEDGTFHWDGLAVFAHDRMVGRLSREEAEVFMRLRDGKRGGSVTVEGANGETVLIKFFHLRRRVKVQAVEDRPQLVVELELEGNVGEITDLGQKAPAMGRINSREARLLEAKAAEKVKAETEQLIRKVQSEYRSDIFGLGEWVQAYRPDLFRENWNEIFPQVGIEVEVTVRLRRYGMTGI